MQTFKFRALHSSPDTQTIQATAARYQDAAIDKLMRLDVKGAARDYDSAEARAAEETPLLVEANERSGTHEQIAQMLREGELAPSDLVFENGAWTTFERSGAFFDVCEDLVDPRQRAATMDGIKMVIGGVVAVVLAAVFIYLRHR